MGARIDIYQFNITGVGTLLLCEKEHFGPQQLWKPAYTPGRS